MLQIQVITIIEHFFKEIFKMSIVYQMFWNPCMNMNIKLYLLIMGKSKRHIVTSRQWEKHWEIRMIGAFESCVSQFVLRTCFVLLSHHDLVQILPSPPPSDPLLLTLQLTFSTLRGHVMGSVCSDASSDFRQF